MVFLPQIIIKIIIIIIIIIIIKTVLYIGKTTSQNITTVQCKTLESDKKRLNSFLNMHHLGTGHISVRSDSSFCEIFSNPVP